MRFSKTNNIYKITRITGSQDNILGVVFDNTNKSKTNIEVIEWNFRNRDRSQILTPKEEVLQQVLSGLELINKSLETNYKLSKIYFSPFDLSKGQIYSGLTAVLIRYYHNGNEFEEEWNGNEFEKEWK